MNVGLMFVVAFFPNFVGSLGLPDVTTSYGYLINGLVGIYVGPALLKSLSGKLGRTACVVISLLLAGASVLILNIDLPLVIVLVSVALLGLFDGFGRGKPGSCNAERSREHSADVQPGALFRDTCRRERRNEYYGILVHCSGGAFHSDPAHGRGKETEIRLT